MTDYSPKPEHKFTFGLWTVGNRGVDPFGSATREHKSPAELVYLLGAAGAFTSNDAKVRAYSLQKTMKAIDLGVEFGAKTYVFWGGREGTETDSSKNPLDAIKRMREAMNFFCE